MKPPDAEYNSSANNRRRQGQAACSDFVIELDNVPRTMRLLVVGPHQPLAAKLMDTLPQVSPCSPPPPLFLAPSSPCPHHHHHPSHPHKRHTQAIRSRCHMTPPPRSACSACCVLPSLHVFSRSGLVNWPHLHIATSDTNVSSVTAVARYGLDEYNTQGLDTEVQEFQDWLVEELATNCGGCWACCCCCQTSELRPISKGR